MALPEQGVVVESEQPVNVNARFFADGYSPTPLGTIPASTRELLKIGPGKSPIAWHLELLPAGPTRVCAAPAT